MSSKKFCSNDRSQVSQLPSSLIEACSHEHIIANDVQELLNRGDDINEMDYCGSSPLHLACMNGKVDLSIIKVFLSAGAEVNRVDECGYSPLHYACDNKDSKFKVVRELLNHGAEVNKVDQYGESPLHKACDNEYSKVEVVRELLNHGAEVNTVDQYGESPLHSACDNKVIKFEVVKELLNHGAEVNKVDNRGYSPLHFACKNKNIDFKVVRELLNHGADVNKVNRYGDSPLQMACKNNDSQIEVVKELLNRGADFNLPTRSGHRSPLFTACRNRNVNIEIVMELLIKDADFNKLDRSLLHAVCNHGRCPSVMEYILMHSFRCNGPNLNMIQEVIDQYNRKELPVDCLKLFIKYASLENPDFAFHSIFRLSPNDSSVLSDFREECFAELICLKNEKIGECLLLHHLLFSRRKKKSFICGKSEDRFFEKIVKILASKEFSIYSNFISYMVDKDTVRNKLQNIQICASGSADLLGGSGAVVLGVDSVCCIARYLSGDDILNLIVTSCVSS